MTHVIEDYNRNNPGKVWRNYQYDLERGRDIAKYVARTCYAWPGGYELFAITDDGGTLCHNCCHSEFYQIASAYPGDGWNVVAVDSDNMIEEGLNCDHCGRVICDPLD